MSQGDSRTRGRSGGDFHCWLRLGLCTSLGLHSRRRRRKKQSAHHGRGRADRPGGHAASRDSGGLCSFRNRKACCV